MTTATNKAEALAEILAELESALAAARAWAPEPGARVLQWPETALCVDFHDDLSPFACRAADAKVFTPADLIGSGRVGYPMVYNGRNEEAKLVSAAYARECSIAQLERCIATVAAIPTA